MSSASASNRSQANPLLGPLTQLGNSLNTNYANSWTLRKLIDDNGNYILAQLTTINQAVTQLQQNVVAARTQITQLNNRIIDLEAQLAAQSPGVSGPNVNPDVAKLQQELVNVMRERELYLNWLNESLVLINQYNAYIQNINNLAPDNMQFTNLINQINQRLQAITNILGLPPVNPPGPPGNPPPPPGGPSGGPPSGGPGGPSGGLPGLSNTGLGGVSSSASSSSSRPSSSWNPFAGLFRGKSSVVPIQPGDTEARYRERLATAKEQQKSGVSLNPNATGFDIVNNSNINRNENNGDEGEEGEFLGGIPVSSASSFNRRLPTAGFPSSSVSPSLGASSDPRRAKAYVEDTSNMSNILRNTLNPKRSNKFSSSVYPNNGGKMKRKRTRKQNYKGGFRLNSNKRTTSRTPLSRSSISSRSSRSSRTSRTIRSSRRSSR